MKKVQKTIAITLAACLSLGLVALGGCGEKDIPAGELTVYMPDGAPALALAGMMAKDTEDDGVTYRVVNASAIATKVSGQVEADNADLCVLPITAASKLLGSGEQYTMLGVVTHGNLYVVSKSETQLNAENLSSLAGKNVGVLNINEVPGMTLKMVLNKHNVAWSVVGNDGTMSESNVNLTAISGADAVGTVEGAEYYLLAEPAASAQAKKGYSIVGDIQALYGEENGYPQAVLVVKNSALSSREQDVKDFVGKLSESAAYLQTATGAELVETVSAHMDDPEQATSLKAPLLTADVLGRCGIYFTYAVDSITAVNAYLQGVLEINDKATSIPAEKFFWTYKQ